MKKHITIDRVYPAGFAFGGGNHFFVDYTVRFNNSLTSTGRTAVSAQDEMEAYTKAKQELARTIKQQHFEYRQRRT